MSCSLFQQHLDDWIRGDVPAATRIEIERHLVGCKRCGELDLILRGSIDLPEAEADPGLTASIMEKTAGSACSRSRERMGSFVDEDIETLDELDRDLMQQHLSRCDDCAELHRVMLALGHDLPRMAERTPPAGFVADVVRATRLRPRSAGIAERLAELWGRLIVRPRFAYESAYVGALLLWLIFGTPISPLREAPQQALAMTRSNPMPQLNARVSAAVRDTTGRGTEALSKVREQIGGGLAETGRTTRDWVDAGLALGENAIETAKQTYVEPLRQPAELDNTNDSNKEDSANEGRP